MNTISWLLFIRLQLQTKFIKHLKIHSQNFVAILNYPLIPSTLKPPYQLFFSFFKFPGSHGLPWFKLSDIFTMFNQPFVIRNVPSTTSLSYRATLKSNKIKIVFVESVFDQRIKKCLIKIVKSSREKFVA